MPCMITTARPLSLPPPAVEAVHVLLPKRSGVDDAEQISDGAHHGGGHGRFDSASSVMKTLVGADMGGGHREVHVAPVTSDLASRCAGFLFVWQGMTGADRRVQRTGDRERLRQQASFWKYPLLLVCGSSTGTHRKNRVSPCLVERYSRRGRGAALHTLELVLVAKVVLPAGHLIALFVLFFSPRQRCKPGTCLLPEFTMSGSFFVVKQRGNEAARFFVVRVLVRWASALPGGDETARGRVWHVGMLLHILCYSSFFC